MHWSLCRCCLWWTAIIAWYKCNCFSPTRQGMSNLPSFLNKPLAEDIAELSVPVSVDQRVETRVTYCKDEEVGMNNDLEFLVLGDDVGEESRKEWSPCHKETAHDERERDHCSFTWLPARGRVEATSKVSDLVCLAQRHMKHAPVEEDKNDDRDDELRYEECDDKACGKDICKPTMSARNKVKRPPAKKWQGAVNYRQNPHSCHGSLCITSMVSNAGIIKDRFGDSEVTIKCDTDDTWHTSATRWNEHEDFPQTPCCRCNVRKVDPNMNDAHESYKDVGYS